MSHASSDGSVERGIRAIASGIEVVLDDLVHNPADAHFTMDLQQRARSKREPDSARSMTAAGREPVIAMALAMDRNRLIGRDGGLPWHIPGELAHFKAVTIGKPILMGRRTFESIGKALPDRPNIVITRDTDWTYAKVDVAGSLDQSLTLGRQRAAAIGADELVIIGGASICREAMPLTTRFHLTLIDAAYEGDVWLDAFQWSQWQELSRESPDAASTGGVQIHYLQLERVQGRV